MFSRFSYCFCFSRGPDFPDPGPKTYRGKARFTPFRPTPRARITAGDAKDTFTTGRMTKQRPVPFLLAHSREKTYIDFQIRDVITLPAPRNATRRNHVRTVTNSLPGIHRHSRRNRGHTELYVLFRMTTPAVREKRGTLEAPVRKAKEYCP